MVLSVICVSDRCSRGECDDRSGPLMFELLGDIASAGEYILVPDEIPEIKKALVHLCDETETDIVLTTGGTGFAPRDVTPEATAAVITKNVPGIAEAIRAESLKTVPNAMLSRAVSGIRGSTLIINLPGSPKAVRETIEIIRPVLPHAVETLSGKTQNCGGDYK